MSPWKVILAALVIFGSGLVTGGMLFKRVEVPPIAAARPEGVTRSNAPLSALWHQQQKDFLRRMDKELGLSAEQSQQIDKILKESHERTKLIREKIAPEMKDELKNVREQIRAQLSEDQQKKFEAAMKPKGRKEDKADEPRRKGKEGKESIRKEGTNAPAPTAATSPQ